MRIQVLMATMNIKKEGDFPRGLQELIENKVHCSVINQCSHSEKLLNIDQPTLNIHSTSQRGLSKSRNQNLLHLTEQIGLFTDQDVRFKDGFENIVLDAFLQHKKADILVFKTEDSNGKPLKKYRENIKWLNQRDIMKVSSIEIAFRSDSIKNNDISFDENFGLGSNYPTGEENIFLSDAIKKGLKIMYIPKTIVIHSNNSSGHRFIGNNSLIKAKGAMLFRIFGIGAYPLSILFAMKKFSLSSETLVNFVTLMYKGISSYKKLINEQA